jgi:hypothetical protein
LITVVEGTPCTALKAGTKNLETSGKLFSHSLEGTSKTYLVYHAEMSFLDPRRDLLRANFDTAIDEQGNIIIQ